MKIGLPRWHSGKESACQCRRHKRLRFDLWVGKISWSRKWQPTPVFLPWKFHGQWSLVGYSLWGHKDSDTTERLSSHTLLKIKLYQLIKNWIENKYANSSIPNCFTTFYFYMLLRLYSIFVYGNSYIILCYCIYLPDCFQWCQVGGLRLTEVGVYFIHGNQQILQIRAFAPRELIAKTFSH